MNTMLAYLFILDYPFGTSAVVAAVVTLLTMRLDQKSGFGSRVAASLFFGAGSFAVVFGGIASYLFHDGILPDDPRTHGWQAFVSFGRAFLPSLAAALVCWSLGFVIRHFAKRRLLHETHAA
jgi:MFS family permease